MCDNINSAHNNETISESPEGIRVRCKECGEVNILRMDADGRMNNKLYSKVFKRDLLQPGENLYYKVYPEKMSIV